jgi:3-oxoadipate enol-lactonase
MPFATLNGVTLHYHYRPGAGVPVVFLNSLGTDFRIWDGVIAGLGADVPVLCLDKRGHGLSDEGPVTMALLVEDVAALMDHLGLSHAVICGVSVGGMIAQGLAAARPDLAAGLVLCCTGTRIGDAEGWNARIETVRRDGIAAMAEAILERWFSAGFRRTETAALAGYRNMLTRTPAAGYAGVCAAIRDTDFTDESARLALPTRCLAGAEDLATPPDLVAALARTIPGATIEILDGCGHLPCIEAPGAVAETVSALRRGMS